MTSTRRAAAAVLLVALLALVVFSERVYATLLRLLTAAQTIATDHPAAAALLVIVFAALSAMLLFVSSWVVVPFAIFTWGTIPALLLLWGGWLLGGVASYGIGRYFGRPAVRRLTSTTLLERYEERVSRRAPFGLILLFQFALPSEIPGYLLGLIRYSFIRYLAALALVELTYGVATVYLGTGVVERRVPLIVAFAAALALLSIWAIRRLHDRLAAERPAGGDSHPTHRNAQATGDR